MLEELNAQQREAVTHSGGPLLVIAGAGTGKTRMLTHRIAHLIEHRGVRESRILAITFTNKAAGEMRIRLRELIPHAADDIWISTIHSACLSILRSDADRLGFPAEFTIYDAADSTRLCRRISDEIVPFAAQATGQDQAQVLRNFITDAKSRGLNSDDLAEHFGPGVRTVRAYAQYERHLARAKAMDFDDLLVNTRTLLRLHDDVRSRWQQRFDHICVDEYQDTNEVQHEIVVMLAARHRQITVVGDPDQSIYAFRGAKPRIIEDFATTLAGTTTVVLDRNYRSTGNIIAAANAVRARNPICSPRKLRTRIGPGALVHRHTAFDKAEESSIVVESIVKRHLEDGVPFDEMAVLSRIGKQSSGIQELLKNLSVPYVVIGANSFYGSDEVRDALCLLKSASNLSDDLNLRRAFEMTHPRLSRRVFNAADAAIRDGVPTFYQWTQRIDEHRLADPVTGAVTQFREMIESASHSKKPPRDTLDELLDRSGCWSRLEAQDSEEVETRLENLTSLLSEVSSYSNIDDFLAHVAISDAVEIDQKAPAVWISTVHASKGLEFRDVYIIGMEDGAVPHSRHKESLGGIGEELRILYVAMTRAKETLTLTHPYVDRFPRYRAEPSHIKPSRFLRIIPQHARHDSGIRDASVSGPQTTFQRRPRR